MRYLPGVAREVSRLVRVRDAPWPRTRAAAAAASSSIFAKHRVVGRVQSSLIPMALGLMRGSMLFAICGPHSSALATSSRTTSPRCTRGQEHRQANRQRP